MCIADVITGGTPPNTEPVHGQCNLATGGQCIVTCKSGYRPSGSRNLAIDRPVDVTGISETPKFSRLPRVQSHQKKTKKAWYTSMSTWML